MKTKQLFLLTLPLFVCSLLMSPSIFAQGNSQAEAVQKEVRADISQRAETQQKMIIKEAVTAVEETQYALQALDKNKPQQALKALEKATGKLDVILSREPKLSLAPVSVMLVIHDLYATPQIIENAISTAKIALSNGEVQRARFLLRDLGSEEIIQVVSIPLATYPAAIKAIVPLIDRGELAEAKLSLQAVLSTLVVTNHVIPLPYLRSIELLKHIEMLGAKKDKSEKVKQQASNVFKAIRAKFELAEVLGYDKKEEYRSFYKQLDVIENKFNNGEPFRDDLNKALKILTMLINQAIIK